MYELGVVYRNIRRADKDVASRLGTFGSRREQLQRAGLKYVD